MHLATPTGSIIDNNKFYVTAGTDAGSTTPSAIYIDTRPPTAGLAITNNTFSVTRTGTTAWGRLRPIRGSRPSTPTPPPRSAAPDSPLTIIGNTITVTDTNTSTAAAPPRCAAST